MSDPNDRTQVRSMGGRAQARLEQLRDMYDWPGKRTKHAKGEAPERVRMRGASSGDVWRRIGSDEGDNSSYERTDGPCT